MSIINLREQSMHTYGSLPKVGQAAPNFLLCDINLEDIELKDLSGKNLLINVYPSVDTKICFESVKFFSENLPAYDAHLVCVSMDLPFSIARVKKALALENAYMLSDFRQRSFGSDYGLTIADGPLSGLLARAVIVISSTGKVLYTELVEDISNPPNYEAALESLK